MWNKWLLATPALLMLLIFSTNMARTQPHRFADTFGPIWERATAYTLEVAATMPEDAYGYQPVDSVLTFGEHMMHIERNLWSLSNRFLQPNDHIPAALPADASKAEIIAALTEALQHIANLTEALSEDVLAEKAKGFWAKKPVRRQEIFWLMRDHMTHHRAQALVYLRANGIEAPRYRGW